MSYTTTPRNLQARYLSVAERHLNLAYEIARDPTANGFMRAGRMLTHREMRAVLFANEVLKRGLESPEFMKEAAA